MQVYGSVMTKQKPKPYSEETNDNNIIIYQSSQ